MAPDSLSKARHEMRTLLNHVVGYTDILLEDTTAKRDEGLRTIFRELRDLVLLLREPIFQFFSESSGPADRESVKGRVYGLLYDIIALLQTAKRQCGSEDRKVFLPDIQKIVEAANGTVEIFENVVAGSFSLDDLSDETRAELDDDAGTAHLTGKVLVVDDDAFNREIMTRHLERQGHAVSQAADGIQALEALRKEPFDIVLLDIMMPGMNGYKFLEKIKKTPEIGEISVIIVSALEESGSVARCLRLGAEDYLPREFDPIVLRARIESCLERKRLRAREELSIRAVKETQKRLAAELGRAAEYVRSLLPRRVRWRELHTDWVFLPSLDLGGDAFGYTKLQNGDIALYLLDVSGHGIEAALLSVSLLNRIQTQSPADAGSWEPSCMLSAFNRSFRSEDQNNLYFTAWFGLWNPETRELTYSGAGSPPAVLIRSDMSLETLTARNPAVGVDEDAEYRSSSTLVPRGASLYLFSDGIFETRGPENRILGLPRFTEILRDSTRGASPGNLSRIIEASKAECGKERFDDDASLVGFYFDA